MAYANISKPSLYMNTLLYAGNGSTQSLTGVDFQPDLVWTKGRDDTYSQMWVDAVRGGTKYLYSNGTAVEATSADAITSFDADGYSIGSFGTLNDNAQNYVSWNWKAGTTSGLSGGTITPSSYSINTTSGFGIYKYSGTGSAGTIAHGLGITPQVVITKGLDAASKRWCLGHQSIGWTKELFLESQDAVGTSSGAWNNTDPTDTLITLGSGGNGNSSGVDYIMYAWAPIKAYSKFNEYTGNGDADGPFCYTGFKPAMVIMKETTDSSTNWVAYNNKISPFNPIDDNLYPNLNNAEGTGTGLDYDFVSNGFKIRNSNPGINADGQNYIYLAFASEPLVANVGGSIPATAR